MEDKIITDTLKYVAKNIAFVYTALNESRHKKGLTRSQKIFTIALADSFVYLERGTITVEDIKKAVETVIAGSVCLDDYSKKTYYSSEDKINCLSTLTMQLSAMFYQDALETKDSQVAAEIVDEVVKRRNEIERAIKHNIRKKEFPDKIGYIRIIDLLFSNEIYMSAIEEFSNNEAMKTYDYVEVSDKPELTKIQNITRVIVKLLIWFGILFSISLILSLVKMSGILLGAIPSAIFYIISLYLCKKAGEGWDNYFHKKNVEKIKYQNLDTELAELKVNDPEVTPNSTNTSAIEEVPQKETEEVMQSENAVPSSYKDEKKAARKNYKEQKRLLKEAHKKPAPKSFKIITIVLCVILCFSLIGNILLAVHVSELENDIAKEKTLTEYYKNKYNDSLIEYDSLEDEYDNYRSKAIKNFSKAYFLDNKLAFIDANDSYHYHTYDCEEFQNADSYYVHNIEYAESQGYRGHSCVIIRRNSK